MLLLSQMYRDGIGVKQSDENAMELLMDLSRQGNSEVDADIAVLNTRIAQQEAEKKAAAAKKSAPPPRVVLKPAAPTAASRTADAASTGISEPTPVAAATTAPALSAAEQAEADKRARYEAVMKRLREEQKMLEEQQKWAETNQ
jgi:uncharacterized small protein (DUF1192 family)